jgi:hypothetical protein
VVVLGKRNHRDFDYNFPGEVTMDVLCLVSRLSLRCHHTEGQVKTLASGLQVPKLLSLGSTALYRSSRATYLIIMSSARNQCRSSSVGTKSHSNTLAGPMPYERVVAFLLYALPLEAGLAHVLSSRQWG